MFVVRLKFERALYDVLGKADTCHAQDFFICIRHRPQTFEGRLLPNSSRKHVLRLLLGLLNQTALALSDN